jgi:phosphoribosylaminoimidazolecarboxamide formyltransferase/IMP cyclohydrolase
LALKPLESLPTTPLKIKRALISLSDKTGLAILVKALDAANVQILSTGGTAAVIREMGISVTDVSEITEFQECLDGRVKTLHPMVHAGILARTSYQPDLDELAKLGVEPIELVAVNLYPFAETIAKPDINLATATEFIDIGGPTMIRAAAKNFAHVAVVTNPKQFEKVANEINETSSISYNLRKQLAKEAFSQTATYDAAIANYLMAEDAASEIPENLHLASPKSQELRYGENPHQKAAVYGKQQDIIEVLHGKELSYNNFLDLDAAVRLIQDFDPSVPTCAIFKHTIPCGVAIAENSLEAYKKAFATDKVSPFGGIVIFNQKLDMQTAKAVDQIFTELIIAPDFDTEVLEFLKEKKNRRLIKLKQLKEDTTYTFGVRTIIGGYLMQEQDHGSVNSADLKIVTERSPEDQERSDLLFAWKIVKHVKSNAIVYVKNGSTLGIGGGQTSRVDASKIAIQKAKEEGLDLTDCVVASDAFYPFSDGVEAAAEAGAKAVIQPGGSVRDQEVIDTANRLGLSMIFTGMRHFKH